MKEYQIHTSDAPVTSVILDGRPHHYFQSEAMGDCRAIRIAENENLAPGSKHYHTRPLSKGEQLEMLMDCGERLQSRYWLFWALYDALPEHDYKGRKALFAKMDAVHDASIRLSRKIGLLFAESR